MNPTNTAPYSKVVLLVLALAIFAGVVFWFMTTVSDTRTTSPQYIQKPSQSAAVAGSTIEKEDPFVDIRLSAVSAFVLDVKTQQVLFTQKPDEQLPLASITKLMTVTLANELLPRNEIVTISHAAIDQDGTSSILAGEQYTVGDLSDIVLVSSSNDGAYALAERAGTLFQDGGAATFIQAMNIKSDELGLTNTYFRNPTGLDVAEGKSGAYSTARDVAFLMQHILTTQPHILEATTETDLGIARTDGVVKRITNTNYYADVTNGLIGSKTGYTELAGGNLVIAYDVEPNHPIVIVVLGSTREGRFTDIDKLMKATNTLFE